ncbi:MarR family winged helix-turn-helix transcriptional regulator [Actinocorallia longicatena]|uniref:HTH marR-type domain-containing protein n=1 Tax=Actinocorallia longicatena TaxID=111803 RepID=A0ABP6Q6X6_9ACTN
MRQPSLLYSIKQVELATRARLDELLKPSGLTTLQYTALTVLERRDDLSGAELARNSFVTPQSMADIIAAVERRGLITRTVDPGNRRRHILALTERGRELLVRYAGPVAALEERMLKDFTRPEQAAFRDYLNRARTAMDD